MNSFFRKFGGEVALSAFLTTAACSGAPATPAQAPDPVALEMQRQAKAARQAADLPMEADAASNSAPAPLQECPSGTHDEKGTGNYDYITPICIDDGDSYAALTAQCGEGNVVRPVLRASPKNSKIPKPIPPTHFWTCVPKNDWEQCGSYGYVVAQPDANGNPTSTIGCWETPQYDDIVNNCAEDGSTPLLQKCPQSPLPLWGCNETGNPGVDIFHRRCLYF